MLNAKEIVGEERKRIERCMKTCALIIQIRAKRLANVPTTTMFNFIKLFIHFKNLKVYYLYYIHEIRCPQLCEEYFRRF